MKATSTISLCLRVVNIPFFATFGLTSVRQIHSCQRINSALLTSFALLETACYQFVFNAASGFILWEIFFEQT